MKLQTPSNVFDMTKCLMKLQEKYLESVRYEFNLSRIEIIILTFLYNNPSYDSARDIVEFRMLQRGNVSAAVDTLEKKGYLIRYTDSDDKRIVHLKLTEQTNDIVHAIEEKQEALLRVKKEMKQSVTTGTSERNWVTLFKQYENIEELNRRVLMALVDRILIYEDHAIEIVFKYKDEYQQTLEYVLGYADELAVAG